jgi:hypothetical protein
LNWAAALAWPPIFGVEWTRVPRKPKPANDEDLEGSDRRLREAFRECRKLMKLTDKLLDKADHLGGPPTE